MLKRIIENREQLGEAVTATMFQAMCDILTEQKQNKTLVDDVMVMIAG